MALTTDDIGQLIVRNAAMINDRLTFLQMKMESGIHMWVGKFDDAINGIHQKLTRMDLRFETALKRLAIVDTLLGDEKQRVAPEAEPIGIAARLEAIEARLAQIEDNTCRRIIPEEHRTIKEQIDYVAAELKVVKDALVGVAQLVDDRTSQLSGKIDGMGFFSLE